jgi:transposase
MGTVSIIGLDIAKSSFSLHGFDGEWRTVLEKTLRRGQVLGQFEKIGRCRVGIEACAASHYWARMIAGLGHDVRLVPAGRVKAFLGRQKNDAADARAIARAAGDPELRCVAVKNEAQQMRQMLFKARDLLVRQRTQLLNALRGHFAEVGIVAPEGGRNVWGLAARLKQEGDLPETMRLALVPLAEVLAEVTRKIGELDGALRLELRRDPVARRLLDVTGIGPVTAVAMSAAVPDARVFKGGREFAAYLGLVPRQHSTGGKARLGRVSKMGNQDLRRLLVCGAVAALSRMKSGKTQGPIADWARKLLARKPFRLVAVALANKMARMAWVVMARGEAFDPRRSGKT